MPRIIIAIPTYNCERQITRVLDEIDNDLAKRIHEIAIIDNGSSDGTVTAAIAYKKKGRLKKLHVYKNVDNYNLGGTHKVAFLRAKNYNYTHIVILHGDNQARSCEVNRLLNYAEDHPETQTVLGSRFNKGSVLKGYDWKRIFGNRVLNVTYTLLTGKRCEDLGSGLNLFALSDLDENTYIEFADKLTFNFELLLDLIKRKVEFAYVPITWREDDQISNARNFNIAKIALINLLKWRFLTNKPRHLHKPDNYQCKEQY